jgi:hypothetical protein
VAGASVRRRARSGNPGEPRANRYDRLLVHIFQAHYRPGADEVVFRREDIEAAADELGVVLPKNLGDVVYSARYRQGLPETIRARAPRGREWVILPAGTAVYRLVATSLARLVPNPQLAETKVPDSTPGVIAKYALTDEQALLAKVRYNRLVDVFTGVTCYSLQSHLRTTVTTLGQVETDEVYIGLDRRGAHYVFPIQVKRGSDALGVVQVYQDLSMCKEKWPALICRPLAAQFMAQDLIAMFELEEHRTQIAAVAAEKHYRLVEPEEVTLEDLTGYRRRTD